MVCHNQIEMIIVLVKTSHKPKLKKKFLQKLFFDLIYTLTELI